MEMQALYYRVPYVKEFEAEVLECLPLFRSRSFPTVPEKGRRSEERHEERQPLRAERESHRESYRVRLSVCGFYPEGGGQPADRGRIGDAVVRDVQEREDGQIWQEVDRPLEVGRRYACSLDWEWRFRLMQHHTGEHIVSGLVHRRFSLDNVGFHMAMEGDTPLMTIDFNGFLPWDALQEVEEEANRAVYADLPVQVYCPSAAELDVLEYRSKRELQGEVRIVEIPGIDRCACCGTHVGRTGEIGIIRLLSAVRHRGGVRVEMLCGLDAYRHSRRIYEASRAAAQMLSVPTEGLLDALARYKAEGEAKDRKIAWQNARYYALRAEACRAQLMDDISRCPGLPPVLCCFEEGMQGIELRRFCEYLMKHTGAELVAVFGKEDGNGGSGGNDKNDGSSGEDRERFARWQYVLGSAVQDVRPLCDALRQHFQGKGGGRSDMAQGSLTGSPSEIQQVCQREFLARGL